MAHPSPRSSTAEIDDLVAEYRATHSTETRNRLVEALLPIADRCARRYADRGEPTADLIQVSRLALIGAVERFDPDRGVPIEAFARPTVLGELRHHFRDRCWAVSVPRRTKDLRSKVLSSAEELRQRLGRSPTPEEIAAAIEETPEHVAATIEANHHFRAVSWEAVATDPDGGGRPGGSRPTEDELDAPSGIADRMDVARMLDRLDPRLRTIVVWRFYDECTQREIGARLGIGQVQVSRLLARALREMRPSEPAIAQTAGRA